ncbi:sigma 54-interacting transcriptional regulator [Polyangium sp. 15x6]|uniref:sigma-54 interaction domain-containing protein n=1 Tax=Polyangium sp. 15x6 TaxID=3042687 RepID=UPI00249AD91F|nr:sigma 54-interacting transcriptional regulator [Polyangium sp. 15x6]MDI3291872.1 sigma 54-interacting transcriptional regulator [Polyangium sp. 15x6]
MAAATPPPDPTFELLAALAEVSVHAHTLPTIVTSAAGALAGHLPLRWFELGRCDPALSTADALFQPPDARAPARAHRSLPGSLAHQALADGAPRLVDVPSAGSLAEDLTRARAHGATTLAALPLHAAEGPAYALLALGPPNPASPTLGPPLLRAIGRVLSVALHHASVLTRVATLSRRAHADSRKLRDELQRVLLPPDVIARSPAMQTLLQEVVPLIARQDTTVLIRGESGTGKEVVARRIHALSLRAHRPFLKVNCGALPGELVESTLFGHERGAFTGATQRHEGLFERAHGGTLLLDEIGDLPLTAQVKLLRVLQEGEIERVGGQTPMRVDVRVLAATHRNLEAMVEGGHFRADLYYRLDVFPLVVPPLRERPEDIEAMVPVILDRLALRIGRVPPRVTPEALGRLRAHAWPGNVRELENVLERALLLSPGETLSLPATFGAARLGPAAAPEPTHVETYEEASRRCIAAALSQSGGKVYGPGGAARLLGLKPSTLQSKMKKLGM